MVYLRIKQVYFYDAISLVYMKNAGHGQIEPRSHGLPSSRPPLSCLPPRGLEDEKPWELGF